MIKKLGIIFAVVLSVVFSSQVAFGATILTTATSDTLGTFRTNVNTSLTNLNNALYAGSFGVLSATSTLSVTGASTLTGGFLSAASSTVNGNFAVTGLLNLLGGLNASSTATSTFANGIQLSSGCFRDVTGSCLVSGASTGVANTWTSLQTFASGLLSTASSTFSGNLTVSGNLNASSTLSALDLFSTSATTSALYVSGPMNLASGNFYQINGTSVLSSNTLGSGILTSSLTSVGALDSGSITSNFGSINIGPDALTAGAASFTTLSASSLASLTGFISSASSTISNSLQLSGSLFASSTLSVGGGTALGSTLSVTGTSTLAGLSAGFGTFSSNVTTSGSLSATNLATLSGGFLSTASSTVSSTFDASGATVKIHKYPGFSFPPGAKTATTTTATTSIPLGTSYVAQTVNSIECWTGGGTVSYQMNDGTNQMNSLLATTTVSRFAVTTNNAFTAGEKRFLDIGNLTASYISCSFDITENQ